ncbi:LacI family DNA-binding transcriptional regulator [Paracoccus nototheniae]|uniref:LacI family DNA-binding transcriptional regulator n=1 Tax=Paracoccus nototheniae TaxID=2489002 RepID=A0ABW4DZ68_9RHOB|nr:LacI family DNA-binding transcriptional regulator [Paracoccus nototheniae]
MDKPVKKPATLRQVADLAGVSASTASLVLNGKGDITQSTRDRVLAAATDLAYAPRTPKIRADAAQTIRFLKLSKHGDTVNRDHNHFISDYIDGMSHEATRRGYNLEVVAHDGVDISALLATADGRGQIILGTELSEEDILTLSRGGQPVVFIDTYYRHLTANFVDMDNDQAVFCVASYLATSGFDRIGFVGSHSDVTNFRLREKAFTRACARLQRQVAQEDTLHVSARRDGAYAEALQHLAAQDSIADAYFCVNDIVAHGLMRALQELGHRIPDDVSVIGFDNLPMSSLLSPALSTVDVPKRQIGAMAVNLLDDVISNGHAQPPMKVLVTGRLILRESTASDTE